MILVQIRLLPCLGLILFAFRNKFGLKCTWIMQQSADVKSRHIHDLARNASKGYMDDPAFAKFAYSHKAKNWHIMTKFHKILISNIQLREQTSLVWCAYWWTNRGLWFIYNLGLMGPVTRCFSYQRVQLQTENRVQNTIFNDKSAILLHPRTRWNRNFASQRQNYVQKMQDAQVTKSLMGA